MKILHMCPAWYDYYELSRPEIIGDHEILFYTLDNRGYEPIICPGIGKLTDAFNPQKTLQELERLCDVEQIDAVTSAKDYPGALFVSMLASSRGYVGTQPIHIASCQHKYYSRCLQRQFVPEATPAFELVRSGVQSCTLFFPIFVKPVRASFSIFADHIENAEEFENLKRVITIPQEFIDQFNWFLPSEIGRVEPNDLLVEQLLHGVQVTLEGYVFDYQVHPVGIVDSYMFPGTICFKRFEYPSQLDESVQQRMLQLAERFIAGLGLNNSIFNIEFMYNPELDTIHIIEVNPRMSPQFADLFEKVDGSNTFKTMLDLGTGMRPILSKLNGQHGTAASFVLRTFEDKRVVDVPSEKERERVMAQHPDARLHILIKEGMRLSDLTQDGKSYRYGLIHLGARDRQELQEKYEDVLAQLTFTFA